MRTHMKPVLLFLCICLGIGSCICGDLERDNPLDSGSTMYTETKLSDISNNPVVTDSNVTFIFDDTNAEQFEYRINDRAWSSVGSGTITISYAALELDEGDNEIEIRMVNSEGDADETPYAYTVTVNLVKETALMLKPLVVSCGIGEQVHVQVMLEELPANDSLHGATFILACDPGVAVIDSVVYNGFIGSVALPLNSLDSVTGRLDADFSLADWARVTGSCPLLDVYLTGVAAGNATLELSAALLSTKNFTGMNSSQDLDPALYNGRVAVE